MEIDSVYENIKKLIQSSKNDSYRSVNSIMIKTYWNIGKVIVDEEQKGQHRAEYGKRLIKNLSEKLTIDFGNNFSERNLRNIRFFYINFPNWNELRSELSWAHYRLLSKVKNDSARNYYLNESIEQNWSSRALERQINSFYYERLLS